MPRRWRRWQMIIRSSAHKWWAMVLKSCRVYIRWSLIDVGWVPFVDSRIERHGRGRSRDRVPICNYISSRSLGLRLWWNYFSCGLCLFLLILSLLEANNLFTDCFQRILFLELMLFHTFHYGFKGTKLSFINLDLSDMRFISSMERPMINEILPRQQFFFV